MNTEQKQAAANAAVLLAFAAGEKIEVRNLNIPSSKWARVRVHMWDFSTYEYRVAVEPVELWVNVYGDGSTGGTHATQEAAEGFRNEGCRTILVREVTDE